MKILKTFPKDLFLAQRFYVSYGAAAVLYLAAFFFPIIFAIAGAVTVVLCLILLIDIVFLFFILKMPTATRTVSDRLSNGEENIVSIHIVNRMAINLDLRVIDELPDQLQERDFLIKRLLPANKQLNIEYNIKPAVRGEYDFGDIVLFIESRTGMLRRRKKVPAAQKTGVFPAFGNLGRKAIFSNALTAEKGSRVMRKIGHSLEFEQIKEYTNGDDIRSINWKATARNSRLMVNSYADERSQQVFCVIDKGRLMKMPFNGLSLLDYAINTTLALTHTCLEKQDRVGLITFSQKAGVIIAADRKPVQREHIMNVLYNEKTEFLESDMELLYLQVRAKIRQRSLLVLFTNFESLNSMKQRLPYLRSISRHHLLVVVFFENTELTTLVSAQATSVEDVYVKTIAGKLAFEKRLIVRELQQHGIISLLSKPEELTSNTINKYLELKKKQAL